MLPKRLPRVTVQAVLMFATIPYSSATLQANLKEWITTFLYHQEQAIYAYYFLMDLHRSRLFCVFLTPHFGYLVEFLLDRQWEVCTYPKVPANKSQSEISIKRESSKCVSCLKQNNDNAENASQTPWSHVLLTNTRKNPVASQPIPVAQSNPLMLKLLSSYNPMVKKAIKTR